MRTLQRVTIIGGGLAGCEAALHLASAGHSVDLFEMRPDKRTPAHKTGNLAELVCSNSFKGLGLNSAHGLFKKELEILESPLLKCAMRARVPAGESLAVDRDQFSKEVQKSIEGASRINVHRTEMNHIDPATPTIVATGPLSSEGICNSLFTLLGGSRLYFFDSLAPIVDSDTIDFKHAYYKNRWEKGDTEDFVNCPLTREEYLAFVQALKKADTVEAKPFEKGSLFEGCLPIEEMAKRGEDTLRFGPLRPVGLAHPRTSEKAYAVLQLRAENSDKSLYNLVGCQTRLKRDTQREVFGIIPALKQASYARYGAMHRNTYIDAPKALNSRLNREGTSVFFAGQLTGAEGYTEAVGTGLFAAAMLYCHLHPESECTWPQDTCIGSLTRYLTQSHPDFQPMNLNFGLFPKVEGVPKARKKEVIIDRCLAALAEFVLPWR